MSKNEEASRAIGLFIDALFALLFVGLCVFGLILAAVGFYLEGQTASSVQFALLAVCGACAIRAVLNIIKAS